jgi:hypothetical protein
MHEAHLEGGSLAAYFSKANGPTGCVVESRYSGAGDDLSIVAPFASQAAISVELTYSLLHAKVIERSPGGLSFDLDSEVHDVRSVRLLRE